MVPRGLQMTAGALGDVSSAKWLCLLRQTGLQAMQTKSHRQPGGKHRVQTVQITLL